LGATVLDMPRDLEKLGCWAAVTISEGRVRRLHVWVEITGPDRTSMTRDGFSVNPSGAIKPLSDDGYDD
jgi:hypothetical protein